MILVFLHNNFDPHPNFASTQKTCEFGREEAAASYINLQDASTYQLIRAKLLGRELNLDPWEFPMFPLPSMQSRRDQ